MSRPSISLLVVVCAVMLVTATASPRSADSAPPTRSAKLLTTLRTVVARSNAPGAVMQVQTPTSTWRRAVGRAQLEPPVAMGVSARFRVASVTKVFVAAVVVDLVADGTLALEDTVEEWLPGRLPGGAGSAITVRDLLRHTSGLADGLEPLDPGGPVIVHTAPGPYRYANRNFIVLGEVVEAATASRFPEVLERRILGPLNLRSTEFPVARDVVPSGLAHGYLPGTPRLDVTVLPVTGAHAGMVSTVSDLARFERALFAGSVFPLELVRAMQAPGAGNPLVGYNAYGLGLMRYPSRCGPLWGHLGRVPGYTSFMLSSADGKRTVVLLLNVGETPNAVLVGGRVNRLVADALCM